MVWRKQINQTLIWISYFLAQSSNGLTREWFFSSYSADVSDLIFILDASPWGLGGVLVINSIIVAYFTSPLDNYDEQRFDNKIGQTTGQQTWEALCILVALRVWHEHWSHRRVSLTIKSDNVAALVLAAQLKAKGPRRIIAKELALMYAEAAFEPTILQHILGVVNTLADSLSRLYEPGSPKAVPPSLLQVARTPVPVRTADFYKALALAKQGG